MKRLNKPQKHLDYKKLLLRVGLYRQSLGGEEGEVFTGNEENRVNLLLKILFPGSYLTAKDNSVLSDNLIPGRRKKEKEEENCRSGRLGSDTKVSYKNRYTTEIAKNEWHFPSTTSEVC